MTPAKQTPRIEDIPGVDVTTSETPFSAQFMQQRIVVTTCDRCRWLDSNPPPTRLTVFISCVIGFAAGTVVMVLSI